MTARDNEVALAEQVERLYARHGGRELGLRTRGDGAGGLRVDFTYDDVDPPAAMEITSMTEPAVRALNADLVALETKLAELVTREGLGDWTIGVRVGSNMNKIRPRLIDLIRAEGRGQGPAHFSVSEAPPNISSETLKLVVELLELGFVSALRLPGSDSVHVFPPIWHDSVGDPGFGTLLRHAIASNQEKLGECRPRETHLVVTLDRGDVSANPHDTPVPDLPPEIDFVWVMLGYYNAKWTYMVWRASKAQETWFLLDHPVGEAPRLAPRSPTSTP